MLEMIYDEIDARCRYTLVDCQNACIQRQIAATCQCIDNRISTAEQLDLLDKHTGGACVTSPSVIFHFECHVGFSIILAFRTLNKRHVTIWAM